MLVSWGRAHKPALSSMCKLLSLPPWQVLDPSWFRGKDCLDIGCNEGVVTLDIALLFQTR